MAHFDSDFLSFFKELEKNNSKNWFDENRKRYEASVKKPFKRFMEDLALAMEPLYGDLPLEDKFSVMRINRDIRFSKDKTPYKIHMAGMVMPGGIKDKRRPGLYVQTNHVDVRVYSGVHMLEKEDLYNVRTHIKENLQEFNKLVSDNMFSQTYGDIKGDKNKRLPADFQEVMVDQPLIANKSFYWFFKLPPKTILQEDVIDQLIDRYKVSLPLNAFFEEGLDR